MAKLKIYECEEREMRNGGVMKKAVIQVEGRQYPDKNVTIWSDHPLYHDIAAGAEIEGEIEVKDSGRPNPKGGTYKDKTLLKPGQAPRTPKEDGNRFTVGNAEIKNYLELRIEPLLQKILAWQDRRDVLDGIEKPKPPAGLDPDAIEAAFNGTSEEDITASSPF